LRRFVQKFGINAILDTGSKRFQELGLRYARLSEETWLDKLSAEPLLLRVPLVRNSVQLSVGDDEETWKKWMEQ
jgi:arsenate reductase